MAQETTPDVPVQAVSNPIICSPFSEPTQHWFYRPSGEPSIVPGRRPASYWYKTTKSYTAQASIFAEEERDELPLINLLRADVRRWRESRYEGASPITKKLLDHWNHPDRERRLFFCQREAVETVIYLTEVLGSGRKPRWTTQLSAADFQKLRAGEAPGFMAGYTTARDGMPRLVDFPADAEGQALTRYGCKMATGSGKTVVMSMLLAWAFCNRAAQPADTRFPDAALILCPNLTIRERLQVLRPDLPDNYYVRFSIVPSALLPLLQTGSVLIKNWHQLAPESPHNEGGETFRVVEKGEESPDAFARRVLGSLADNGPVLVLNDEGHHAYRPKALSDEEIASLTEEERKEREEATVWISGIDRINRGCGVRVCVDLSATPFFIKGSGYAEGAPFPWLVSDFGLVDAIESGLVKIPRLPVSDQTGLPEPKYFNLWRHITDGLTAGEKLQGGRPKPEVVWRKANDALKQLASQYEERYQYHLSSDATQLAIPPVMIVVCDNTNLAELFYQNLSGETVVETEETITRGQKKSKQKLSNKKPSVTATYSRPCLVTPVSNSTRSGLIRRPSKTPIPTVG